MNILARNTDPITSHLAAEQMNPTAHYELIINALEEAPGGIYLISLRSGLNVNQIARRLPELKKQGLVKLTGNLVTNATNRKEREWMLVKEENQ